MRASFRIGRIAGIDIGINYTWIFAFFLIAWSFAIGVFPRLSPGSSATAYWIAGFAEALLLFICVLLHELAHSLVARSRGMTVNSITLFIFGGVSNLQEEPAKAGTEFYMAIVGPVTSLILSGVFYVGFSILYGPKNLADFLNPIRPLNLIEAIIFWLGYINLSLGLFNLIPGFPLDGGRVLRSIIWGATKNLRTATNIAAGIGQGFGWILIGLGVYIALMGNILSGLWIAFIGWFLNSAADSSRRELTMRETLRGVHVRDVMDPSPACIGPETPVSDIVQQTFLQAGYRAAPVCQGDKLDGIVTITDVKKIPQDRWTTTPVSEIMTREPLYTVNEDDDLGSAIKLLSAHDLNQLIVLKEGHLAGLLNRSHVIRYLQLKQELNVPAGTSMGRRPSSGGSSTPGGSATTTGTRSS